MSAEASPSTRARECTRALPPAGAGRLRFLVTAGPTREAIDEVRFLSNRSSGRMGVSVAKAAVSAGHQALLIHGPIENPPGDLPGVPVESAIDMRDAALAALPWCDCLVMAAAPADYRPAETFRGKIRKSAEDLTLRLVRTPDILCDVRNAQCGQFLIGFALESGIDLQAAEEKRSAKGLDLVVANSVAAFAGDTTDAVILRAGCPPRPAPGSKEDLARLLVETAADAIAARTSGH